MNNNNLNKKPQDHNLGQQVVRGTAWVIALRTSLRLLGVISTLILARLLAPTDYGLIALATSMAAAVQLLGAFNFEMWLIRHPNPTPQHYNTLWSLSIIRNLLLALVLFFVAGPTASLFDDQRLVNVLQVLSLSTLLGGFVNTGITDFQKDMAFNKEFQLYGCVKLGAFVVTVSVAWWLRSYWALLAGIVTSQVLTVILSYLLHPFRPRWSLRLATEAFSFAKWLLSYNFFSFMYNRGATFVVGHLLGSQSLGLYTMAQEIANLASSELLLPLRRVLFPAYATLVDDMPGLRHSFIQGFALILLLGLPLAAGVGLVARPLVLVALGDQWLACIELIQLMSLYALSAVCMANINPLLLALGHSRLTSHLMILGVILLGLTLPMGAYYDGLGGAATAVVACNIILCLFSILVTLHYIQQPLMPLLQQVWRSAVATLVMAASLIMLSDALTRDDMLPFVELILLIITGAISYSLSVMLLWLLTGRRDGPEKSVLTFVTRLYQRRFNKQPPTPPPTPPQTQEQTQGEGHV